MTTHNFPLNGEFDLLIDDKNGKSGSKRRGKKSYIIKTSSSVCKCKRKARFNISRCLHNCCGRCLKLATAFVSFENHESTEVFVCPICKTAEREVLSWIQQKDVLDQLFQRNICICCFQIKTFGVTKCNHGICCLCIRQLLENPNAEQYPCPWTGCDVTYDLTSLSEMYTDTLAEMSQELFQRPYTRESSCCRNMAVLKLKTCYHTLCMDCADKAPLVDNSSENEENLQKCPLQDCITNFPKECLDYYMQQLKSNMQMTTFFMGLVQREPHNGGQCDMCNETSNEELVKIKLCLHNLCHPCLKKIVAANAPRELPNLDVTPTESLKCPKADCYTKLPIICAEAMNLALEGNLIAVAMFLRSTRKAYSRGCSKCNDKKSYVEIISCSHYLCRQCVMDQISKATDSKLAACIRSYCNRIPVQCLKDVISKPIEQILKNNVDYFTELTKRVGMTEETDGQQSNDNACGRSFSDTADTAEKLKPSTSRRLQSFDLLRPFFGKRNPCNRCCNMAVIVFETCSHGWCFECLQKRTKATSKDEKLHCKDCPSCGNIGNASRFLKKCRTEGLLIPAYIQPVSGSTSCVCKTNQAMFKTIDCGHRFCKKCIMLSFALTCPLDKNTKNMTHETLESQCSACFKYEPCTLMEPCRHAICMNCVLRVFVCPDKACESSIDEESSMFLLTHIETQQEKIFISRVKGTEYDCSKCKIKFNGRNENQLIIQIKRCGHFICNQCFGELQEQRTDLEVSTCPFTTCNELFFLPPLQEDKLNASNADEGMCAY